ncbi:MAG: PIN-like domain-containing protein [Paenibacillus sp.]|uniref:PIN-like domain-containing protein n=1 Tax=Paenibacillus sp. TaxID=58172 RepID=UPI003B797149
MVYVVESSVADIFLKKGNNNVKNFFPGYYKLTDDELHKLWEYCNFVLDANTLLNLFRYPKETSNVMLKLLESIKERIWIPHQVALEYHRHLEAVIHEQKNEYETLEKECMSELQKLISKLKKLRHSNISTNSMVQTLEQSSAIIQKELANQQENQPDLQEIKLRINNLIGENVGLAFDQVELDKIFVEGSYRYEHKLPPGYMDGKKNYSYFHNGVSYQAAYGDLIFWKQILRYAEESEVNSIILISDDRKEDWILEVSGEKKGIHPYLTNEFNNHSGGKTFNSYNSVQFISQAEKFLEFESSATVSDVIKEIETVYKKEDSIQDSLNYFSSFFKNKNDIQIQNVKDSEAHFFSDFIEVKSSESKKENSHLFEILFQYKNEKITLGDSLTKYFPTVIEHVLSSVLHDSNIVDFSFSGDEICIAVFSMPYDVNGLGLLLEDINSKLENYYPSDYVKALRIFKRR